MIVKCVICDKNIKTTSRKIGDIARYMITSKEGLLFKNKWFCSSCIRKINMLNCGEPGNTNELLIKGVNND